MNRRKREQLIFDAAARVVARKGYQKTSVSEIIDEAGVARGTFYLYFKSKHELFSNLMNRFLTDVSRDIAAISLQSSNGNAFARQGRLTAGDLIKTITQNRPLAKILLLQCSDLDQEFKDRLTLFDDQIAGIIRNNLDLGVKEGLFRTHRSDSAAYGMIGAVKEAMRQWLVRDNFELENSINGLIDYLISGLTDAPHDTKKTGAAATATARSRPNAGNLH